MAKRRGGGLSLLLFLVCLLATGWVPAAAQNAGKERALDGGVYRRPLGNDPATLDPASIRDIYSLAVSQQIFDGLVKFDQTLTITPALAQQWKASRDGLVWTFTLRRGVKFHHGREVTADDVIYSFTRIVDPKTRSGAADLFLTIRGAQEFREGKAKQISGLTALDRYAVQVTLTEALAPFVSVLAVGHAKILPRDLVEQQGESFGGNPVGTGPFKFVRWERGKEIVLAANPDYFDGSPRLSRIVYRIFPGDLWESMYEEFRRGNIEDSPIPARGYRKILAEGNQVYVKRPMFSVRFYGLNTRVKPLDDRRVRQALVYAIDREALLQEVLLGRFALARGILPPGTPGFDPKLKGHPYDPQRAQELLRQAGYPGGRGLPPITVWSSVKLEQLLREQEQIKRYWEAVGIHVEFRYLTDWPSYSKMLSEGKFPVFPYAWYADVPDPDNFLFKLFYSRSPRNFFGYANPVVDNLLLQARREADLARRVDLYRKAEELILEDAPIIPIMHHTYERLFQPYVKSVEVNGLGDPYIPLRKIWLDRPR
ncbi:MAG: ABC transporter substrate-binding protein [Candidatus Rokubacteria bacterium]|nr:ABC transporter substrate-binding protein [Candidatus Rokubacteria bacterium]